MKNILVFLTCIIFFGCINYEQEVFIRSNGSGSAKVHYWTDFKEIFEDTSSTNKFSFQKSIIKKNFELEGLEIKSINVWIRDTDTTYHAEIMIIFENINDLNKTPFFREDSIVWKDGAPGHKLFSQKVRAFVSNQGRFDNYYLRFTYHFPGIVIFDNAREKYKSRLVWHFNLSELTSEKTLLATIKLPENSVISSFILAGLIVFLLILMLILFLKKKKKYEDEL